MTVAHRKLSVGDLDRLLNRLAETHQVIGPTIREGAICYGPVGGVDDLPRGWTEVQEKGTYRLTERKDQACFGYTVGPHSLKNYLHPARERLWQARRTDSGFQIETEPAPDRPLALVGPRGCDLSAVAIQDRVFLAGDYQDTRYQARKQGIFTVAVHCTVAAPTCFCTSMGTGPTVKDGLMHDLALTEVLGEDQYFVCDICTSQGEQALSNIGQVLTDGDLKVARDSVAQNAARIQKQPRQMNTEAASKLNQHHDHPHWDLVAERCLNCANCTLVCPTCFCSTVEDVTDLSGEIAERWRRWDSCFNLEFSYLHGGEIRRSGASRYRQWLTHKLSSWIEQFDTSGCVGCGRCITWCPVGIDLTEETAAIGETHDQED